MAEERRHVDGEDETARHLEAALESADDDSVRYHIRQALQLHYITRERDRGD